MSDNLKIAKNSIILYIRLLVVLAIGLLSSRYILQALGASDFGLYNVVGGIVSMMAVLNSVMTSTTYRFIAIELGKGDHSGVNRVFNISLVIHIIIAIIVLLLAESAGIYYIKHFLNIAPGKLYDALFVFRLSIISTIFTILSIPFQGLIIAKEKFSVTATVEILRSFLALVVIILVLYYTGNRLRLYAVLIAIISILPAVLYFLYTTNRFSSFVKFNFQKEKRSYKEMVNFSGWLMFGASASVAEIQGSVLIINLFFGTVMNASYGIANQVNSMVKMFAQSLNQAVIPQITISHGGGNTVRTMQLVIFSSKYAFFLMLIPALPILLETNFILKIWLIEVPEYTSIFIKIMILNALISTMNSGIYAAVQATGKIKYFQIILSSIVLTGLPASYIFFKFGFPAYTILLVYTGIYFINNFIVIQILLRRIIDIDLKEYFRKAYLKMLSVTLVMSPFFLIVKLFENSIQRFVGLSFVSIICLFTAIYYFGLDDIERKTLGNYLRKFIHRYFKTTFE